MCVPLPSCLHTPVVCTYIFQFQLALESDQSSERYSWFKGNYRAITSALFERDWGYEFAFRSVDACYLILMQILTSLVDQHVPVMNGAPAVPWRVHPPRALKRMRKHAWELYKEMRHLHGRQHLLSVEALGRFNDANCAVRNYAVASRSAYERNLIGKVKEAPKLFHSYIRWKKKGRPSVGPLKLPNGEITNDSGLLSNTFVDAFASVFVREDPPLPVLVGSVDLEMEDIHLSVDSVRQALMSLDSQSSMGPDNLHPMLLKSCAVALAYPLYIIYEKSLYSGQLPAIWKSSVVIPIFKKGTRFDPLNYRPISLTSVCCKTMERILAGHIYDYLEGNSLLSSSQFGFRKG